MGGIDEVHTIRCCIRCYAFFLSFRQRITDGFSALFGEGSADIDEYSEQGQFGKQWGWYHSIYALAKGDITRFDSVTRERLVKCLTLLTFEKQKNEIEVRQLNKKMRQQ